MTTRVDRAVVRIPTFMPTMRAHGSRKSTKSVVWQAAEAVISKYLRLPTH